MEHQAKSAAEQAPARARAAEPRARRADDPHHDADERKLARAVDRSPRIVAQRALAEALDNSPRVTALRELSQAMNNRPRTATQRKPTGEAEERESNGDSVARRNETGMPDQLKSGVESLSGISLDNVRVHYNSSQPAQVNALAYAQGTDIHVAPGQERHLPHEAWHVVQQAQGRVTPTLQMQMKGVAINDDAGLEREADVMGAIALHAPKADPSQQIPSFLENKRHVAQRDQHGAALKHAPHPLQRVMQVLVPVIHTPAVLTPAAAARLQSVATTLATTLHTDPTINLHSLIISVEQEGGTNYQGAATAIGDDNPALTITLPLGANPPDIQITIQRPFAEKATEGELLGLLAHEVGAHNLPDLRGVNDTGVNAFLPIHTPRKTAKANTPSGGYEFQNWPAPGPGAAPASRHGKRQHDHLMVADILRNPPPAGGIAPLTRANVYFETVIRVGDTIWADPGKTLAQKTTQTNELVHIYLVDIARIIASDDGRMPPASHALAINDIYGRVFDQVVLPQRGAHPWIPAARPKSNFMSLGISLAAFIAKVKIEKKLHG